MTKKQFYPKTQCSYCTRFLSNIDKVKDGDSYYHKLCLEARENVKKYFRGELSAWFYSDEPESNLTEQIKTKRIPIREIILDKIKEYNQIGIKITWGEIREEFSIRSDSRFLKQLIIEKKVKVVHPPKNGKKQFDWKNSLLIAL